MTRFLFCWLIFNQNHICWLHTMALLRSFCYSRWLYAFKLFLIVRLFSCCRTSSWTYDDWIFLAGQLRTATSNRYRHFFFREDIEVVSDQPLANDTNTPTDHFCHTFSLSDAAIGLHLNMKTIYFLVMTELDLFSFNIEVIELSFDLAEWWG